MPRFRGLVVVVLWAVGAAACGIKGPPRPPAWSQTHADTRPPGAVTRTQGSCALACTRPAESRAVHP